MSGQFARAAIAIPTACALIACSSQSEPAGEDETSDRVAAAPEWPEIAVSPLSEADIATADLPDELACAFSEGGNTLLFARAFVGDAERGAGIVRIDGAVMRLTTLHEGGFAAMEERGEFSGDGVKIDVDHVSDNLADHEGSTYEAILTVRRGDSNHAIQGQWNCGP